MPAWLIWLIVAAVLAAAESLSLDLVLVMAAGGAAAGGITAAAGAPAVAEVAVALAATVGLLLFVRPVARRHLQAGTGHQTGVAALVGRSAIVLSRVDAHDGRVRLNGGEWSARSMTEGQIYPAGTRVRVHEIVGATAVVFEEPFEQS
jgi:membrane protein implicated in regulation of membrane protease activity